MCMQQAPTTWALTGWGSRLYSLVAGIAPCSGDNYTVYCLPWGGHWTPTTSSTTPEKLRLFCDKEKKKHFNSKALLCEVFNIICCFLWKLNKVTPVSDQCQKHVIDASLLTTAFLMVKSLTCAPSDKFVEPTVPSSGNTVYGFDF